MPKEGALPAQPVSRPTANTKAASTGKAIGINLKRFFMFMVCPSKNFFEHFATMPPIRVQEGGT